VSFFKLTEPLVYGVPTEKGYYKTLAFYMWAPIAESGVLCCPTVHTVLPTQAQGPRRAARAATAAHPRSGIAIA